MMRMRMRAMGRRGPLGVASVTLRWRAEYCQNENHTQIKQLTDTAAAALEDHILVQDSYMEDNLAADSQARGRIEADSLGIHTPPHNHHNLDNKTYFTRQYSLRDERTMEFGLKTDEEKMYVM